jgi:hypothetical protein
VRTVNECMNMNIDCIYGQRFDYNKD